MGEGEIAVSHRVFAPALCVNQDGLAMPKGDGGILYFPDFLSEGELYSYKRLSLSSTLGRKLRPLAWVLVGFTASEKQFCSASRGRGDSSVSKWQEGHSVLHDETPPVTSNLQKVDQICKMLGMNGDFFLEGEHIL